MSERANGRGAKGAANSTTELADKALTEAENQDEVRTSAPEGVASASAAAKHAEAAHADPQGEHGKHDDEEHPPAETDRLNVGVITSAVLVTVVIVAALVVGTGELFTSIIDGEISEKVLEHQAADMRELRATEQDRLTHYRWTDQKQGVLHIPLDIATKLTLEDYRRKPAAPVRPAEGTVPAKVDGAAPAKDEKAPGAKDPKAAPAGKDGKAAVSAVPAAPAAPKPAPASPEKKP